MQHEIIISIPGAIRGNACLLRQRECQNELLNAARTLFSVARQRQIVEIVSGQAVQKSVHLIQVVDYDQFVDLMRGPVPDVVANPLTLMLTSRDSDRASDIEAGLSILARAQIPFDVVEHYVGYQIRRSWRPGWEEIRSWFTDGTNPVIGFIPTDHPVPPDLYPVGIQDS